MATMQELCQGMLDTFNRIEKQNTETLRVIDSVKVENEKLKETVNTLSEADTKKTEKLNHLMSLKDDMHLQIKELEREVTKLNNKCQAQGLKILDLETMNQNLQTELAEVKEGIILSKENRKNRESTLSDDDIEFIKKARADGLTLRKIGEMIDMSHTTVANVLKAEIVKTESDFTNEGVPKPDSFPSKKPENDESFNLFDVNVDDLI